MKIIDGHVHIDPKAYASGKEAAAALIEEMDRAGVERAIVMPDGVACTSETALAAAIAHPQRLAAFYMPDIAAVGDGKDLISLLAARQFNGLKLHPRNQRFTLDDPAMGGILAAADELHMPVFIDCFPFGDLNERNYPLAFDRLAKRFSSVTLIMGHLGGYRVLEAFIAAKSNKNIYLDLSFTPMYFCGSSIDMDIRYILRKLGPERCVYGSDYPYMGMRGSLDVFLGHAKTAGLRDEDIARIMHANIAAIAGM